MPAFSTLNSTFPPFSSDHRFADVECHGSDFRIGHHAAWTENLAQFAHHPHHVRSGDGLVEIEPTFLDLLGQILSANVIRSCIQCFFFLFSFGKNENPSWFFRFHEAERRFREPSDQHGEDPRPVSQRRQLTLRILHKPLTIKPLNPLQGCIFLGTVNVLSRALIFFLLTEGMSLP